jgi:chemotaxis protein methyltransferase CheR
MALAVDDYIEFCSFVRRVCGIDLSQYKRPQMERRLRSYFAQQGVANLTEGADRLMRCPNELDGLLDRITINVSQLWRNPEQWELLAAKVLPELAVGRHLEAWSAGCSYGAEAFTLAQTCRDAIPGVSPRILGIDIDRRMIARARHAVFNEADIRSTPPASLARGFERVPEGWQARPELRQMVRFEQGDLLRIRPRRESFDLVLCRNTVIYFAEPMRDELHARLASSLRPGGCLVVGSTERVSEPAAMGLLPTHPFIYRKA